MEQNDIIYWAIEVAPQRSAKLDFATRLRVWEDEILSMRIQNVVASQGSPVMARRMSGLIITDADNLIRRARKEHAGNQAANRVWRIADTALEMINMITEA